MVALRVESVMLPPLAMSSSTSCEGGVSPGQMAKRGERCRGSKAVPDGPQGGEDGQEQRALEELGAERAAGAALAADGALDELDVAVAPLLQALVEVGEQLEQQAQVGPVLVQAQQLVLH